MATKQLRGFDELNKKLDRLAAGADSKIIRRAAASAMLPVVKEAESRVPKGDKPHKTYRGRVVAPGFASRNIKRKSKIDKRTGVVRVRVGVANEAFYATQFVERGTQHMRAQPWLEPAFESRQDEVLDRFKGRLRKIIEKEARKK